MMANTTLYDAEYPGLLEAEYPDLLVRAFQAVRPSQHYAVSVPHGYISELLKVLAAFQAIATALDPHVLQPVSATPIHTATTTTDTSPASRQQMEELLEVSLPRLPISVQRASVSFVIRTHTEPRLVGGSDVTVD